MIALAITQHGRVLAKNAGGLIGTILVHDQDWIWGREEAG